MDWLRNWIYRWIFHDNLERALMKRVREGMEFRMSELGQEQLVGQRKLLDLMDSGRKRDEINDLERKQRHKELIDALHLIAEKK
jgi:hypothetical protein